MFIKQFLKVCVTGVVFLAALALFMAPRAVADSKKSVSGGLDVTSTLNKLKEEKSWQNVVDPQLARRFEQEKKKEDERIAAEKAAEEARKAEEARVIASQPVAAPTPPPVLGGSHEDWMAAAGIPQNLWGYVDSIVSRESGWNPNAVNRSSGACGLGQQLPCGKWAGAWNDPVAALVAMTGYVNARYGGWAGAVSFWNSHHWY